MTDDRTKALAKLREAASLIPFPGYCVTFREEHYAPDLVNKLHELIVESAKVRALVDDARRMLEEAKDHEQA